jgi:multimeric flavodoxin WrbA
MQDPRTLVVYYSRDGHTRAVAGEIARALGGADIEEIRDEAGRHGLIGYWRSCRDAMKQRTTRLADRGRDVRDYDTVVVGGPVWVWSLSSPVRTWLTAHAIELKQVAFFLTHGGTGRDRVFMMMTEVSGRTPVALMSVREKDVGKPETVARIAEFAAKVRRGAPASAAPEQHAHAG